MSEVKHRLSLYDFDGTLTRGDSLLAFIRYAHGLGGLLAALLRLSPLLVLMKLHLYDNGRAKQRLFAHLFKGMALDRFNALCRGFAGTSRDRLLRPDGLERLREDLRDGCRVLVVSASIDNWVAPFFTGDRRPEVVGTQVEVEDGHLTGRFLTPNCYGAEKVRRVEALLDKPRSAYFVTAYGDSRGDREMLAFADEGHYRLFKA